MSEDRFAIYDGPIIEELNNLSDTHILALSNSLKQILASKDDVAVKTHLETKNIHFDVEMPSIRADENSMITSAIRNNEAMNKEVFSLLLLNRFIPVSQGNAVGAGGVTGKASSEVLSNQLTLSVLLQV